MRVMYHGTTLTLTFLVEEFLKKSQQLVKKKEEKCSEGILKITYKLLAHCSWSDDYTCFL